MMPSSVVQPPNRGKKDEDRETGTCGLGGLRFGGGGLERLRKAQADHNM
jgi:hypothetical protein